MAAVANKLDRLLKTPPWTRARRIAAIGTSLCAAWLGALFVARRLDPERRHRVIRAWAGSITRSLRCQVSAEGSPTPAGNGVLLIANHVSWLDICVIASITGATFVAKSEVARWPVIGRIATGFGAFLHERGNLMDVARVKNRVAAALREGSPIAVFPEGTTGWSVTLMPFYPALAQAAVDAGAIVQPVALRYRDLRGHPSTAAPFLGDQTFVDSLSAILKEPAIRAELFFGEPFPASGRTRREITVIAHRFIARALGLRESRIRADPRRLRSGTGALISQNSPNHRNLASPTHSPMANSRS